MERILARLLSVDSCMNTLNNILSDYIEEITKFNNFCSSSTDLCEHVLSMIIGTENQDREPIEEMIRYGFLDSLALVGIVYSIAMGDPYINRFSQRISRIYREYVFENYIDSQITRIFNLLGIRLEFSEECFKNIPILITRKNEIIKTCYSYRLPIIDYIRCAKTLLSEVPWRLISLHIDRGFVYIDNRKRVVRLLEEYLKNFLSDRIRVLRNLCLEDGLGEKDIINIFSNTILSEILLKIVNSIRETNKVSLDVSRIDGKDIGVPRTDLSSVLGNIKSVDELVNVSKEIFPPCINSLLESLLRGENLSHHQRFALATFLINIGLDIEVILQLFRYSPDFNEKIARYQIEHLAGLRGSKRKYLTYNCGTMRVLGMCRAECGIKNPLQYPYRVAKRGRKQ
ncbi:DNA primase, large subunit [Ignisphaera aggregans DSM 17230]|uniref:DNA primase large subunit PriL n=1 Tax=Ignisphaera aggregans (strain DSM 17230 / JCM 13409 / AQ1.S1) TaxID=583356 RepID=E0SPE0_IGNAA|nr:DNA primase, large subunit [Ignisphaera aggregans DSM 17230]